MRSLFGVCVTGTAMALVLVGTDAITSSLLAGISAVLGSLASVVTAERWTNVARRQERLAYRARRLAEFQLDIDEARWRLAADRRTESVEVTMEYLRKEFEDAVRLADADAIAPPNEP
jgi:hypothetical protein